MTQSVAIAFLQGVGPDASGRRIHDILNKDDVWLEECHDHIQFLFPLDSPSQYNPNAPVLTKEEIKELRESPMARAGLMLAFKRMLQFYGLDFVSNTVVLGGNWAARRHVLFDGTLNHNHLRVTRILTSLHLAGMHKTANAFFKFLKTRQNDVDPMAFTYWEAAANDDYSAK